MVNDFESWSDSALEEEIRVLKAEAYDHMCEAESHLHKITEAQQHVEHLQRVQIPQLHKKVAGSEYTIESLKARVVALETELTNRKQDAPRQVENDS